LTALILAAAASAKAKAAEVARFKKNKKMFCFTGGMVSLNHGNFKEAP
jgi:hypothetical protein